MKTLLLALALIPSFASAETLWCRGGIGTGIPSPVLDTYISTSVQNGQLSPSAQQYLKFNRWKQKVAAATDVPSGFCALASRAMTDTDPAILAFDKPLLNYSFQFSNPNSAYFQTRLKTKILSKDTVLQLNITSGNATFFHTDNADFQ